MSPLAVEEGKLNYYYYYYFTNIISFFLVTKERDIKLNATILLQYVKEVSR